jgi:hypothetical protein
MKTIPLLLLLSVAACNTESKKQNKAEVNDTLTSPPGQSNSVFVRPIELTKIDLAKIECVPMQYRPNWRIRSYGTLSETTYVYDSPNVDAHIKDTLTFNTPINILGEFADHFLVCTPSAGAGYVKKVDISLETCIGLGVKFNYLIGLSKYGTADRTSCARSTLKMIKTTPKNEIVHTYIDSIRGIDFRVKNIYSSSLKNVQALFYINYDCYSEIGISVDHFVIDTGKLSRLLVAGSSGDGDISDVMNVYLPIHLTNGKKVVLARNGILTVDETTAKVQIYKYPKDCGVPIEELVVVEDTSEEMGWNEDKGEPLYNDDGTQALSVTVLQTTFYRWNGSELQKVKTIVGKQ